MRKKTYELGLTRWGPDYADPMTYLDLWITGASTMEIGQMQNMTNLSLMQVKVI